jgi:hypothetical protein
MELALLGIDAAPGRWHEALSQLPGTPRNSLKNLRRFDVTDEHPRRNDRRRLAATALGAEAADFAADIEASRNELYVLRNMSS